MSSLLTTGRASVVVDGGLMTMARTGCLCGMGDRGRSATLVCGWVGVEWVGNSDGCGDWSGVEKTVFGDDDRSLFGDSRGSGCFDVVVVGVVGFSGFCGLWGITLVSCCDCFIGEGFSVNPMLIWLDDVLVGRFNLTYDVPLRNILSI